MSEVPLYLGAKGTYGASLAPVGALSAKILTRCPHAFSESISPPPREHQALHSVNISALRAPKGKRA